MNIARIISRRKFFSLLNVTAVLPLIYKEKSKGRLPFTLNELCSIRLKDIIEEEPYYLNKWGESSEYSQTISVIQEAIRQSYLKPPKENIVVVGAYKCKIVDMLKKKYKDKNCIGIDTIKHTNHPNLIISDIKLLKSYDFGPIGLGWNNVFTGWKDNPRLKLAGFNFLNRSLAPGGFLIDDPLSQIPKDLNTKNFRLIKSSNIATTWQKALS